MHDTTLFEFYRGDDYSLRVEVTDENDLAVDITGWVFKATMKLSKTSDDVDAAFTFDSAPLDLPEATYGVFYLEFPSSKTELLYPTTYYFGLQREFAGKVVTVMTGRVLVKPDITQRVG